jgi:hypothetical protein
MQPDLRRPLQEYYKLIRNRDVLIHILGLGWNGRKIDTNVPVSGHIGQLHSYIAQMGAYSEYVAVSLKYCNR